MARIYHIRNVNNNNIRYFDWELCSLSDEFSCSDNDVYLTWEAKEYLNTLVEWVKDNKFVPPQGSDINVIAKCTESIDNIRKCYNVKKGCDTGVCNVFSYWPSKYLYHSYVELAICPSLKKICLYHIDHSDRYKDSHDVFRNILRTIYLNEGISDEDFISEVIMFYTHVYLKPKNEGWEGLLKGTLTKPCIHVSNLDLNSGDELTADVLSLVHLTGSVQANEPDAEKNFVLQLNVLNNYNWREYPHTMYLLFGQILLRIQGGIERWMHYHPSYFKQAYNKIVKQFIKEFHVPSTEITRKDFDMAQGMLKKILNVEDTIFVSPSSLNTKLENKGIDMKIFEQYFNSIVKITPKINNCA